MRPSFQFQFFKRFWEWLVILEEFHHRTLKTRYNLERREVFIKLAHPLDRARRDDHSPLRGTCQHILEICIHSRQRVTWQRPRCRRPHHQRWILESLELHALLLEFSFEGCGHTLEFDWKPHIHAWVVDITVAIRDFVGA